MGSLNYPKQGAGHGAVDHRRADIESPPGSPDIPTVSIEDYEYRLPSDDHGSASSSSMRLYASDGERISTSVGTIGKYLYYVINFF